MPACTAATRADGSMKDGAGVAFRVGVDIGGTFTDIVFLRPDGRLDKRKVPSTPADYSRASIDGGRGYCSENDLPSERVSEFVHATTVATNAILERKGARTALITTEGFRDVLIIGRQKRYDTYDMYLAKPVPLVRRRDIF